MDSDDDEERKLLLSESPSLTNSPVITKELVKEAARGSRRQQEAKEARKHQLLPRLAWTTGPSMEADKECDNPDSFSLFYKSRIRDLYNRGSFTTNI